MPGETTEPDTEHELTFKPTERRVEKATDTLTLDSNPYGDGDAEPVEKADRDGERQTLDADDLAAELRKAAERTRPDALDPDALAKDHTDRQPEPLAPEKLREELHDQNLSTKGAVLEVRDEVRELREDGVVVGGREVSKDADTDDLDADPDERDANPGVERLSKGTQDIINRVLDLAGSDPDPEEWDAVRQDLDDLTDLALTVDADPEDTARIERQATRLRTLTEQVVV